MNNKNLINLKTRTKEERRAIAKKGNQASLKAKQEKKKLKELANEVIYGDNLNQEEISELKELGIKDKEMFNTATYLVWSLIKRAKCGDTRAFEKILELTGEDNGTSRFNETLNLKERELKIKEQELELRERKLALGIGEEENETTIIVNIDDESKIKKELEKRNIINPSTIIVNDLPRE